MLQVVTADVSLPIVNFEGSNEAGNVLMGCYESSSTIVYNSCHR